MFGVKSGMAKKNRTVTKRTDILYSGNVWQRKTGEFGKSLLVCQILTIFCDINK